MQDHYDENEIPRHDDNTKDNEKTYRWRTHDDPSATPWGAGTGQFQTFTALLPMLFSLGGRNIDSIPMMSLRLQLLIWWLETWIETMGAAQQLGINALKRLNNLDLSGSNWTPPPSGEDREGDW